MTVSELINFIETTHRLTIETDNGKELYNGDIYHIPDNLKNTKIVMIEANDYYHLIITI